MVAAPSSIVSTVIGDESRAGLGGRSHRRKPERFSEDNSPAAPSSGYGGGDDQGAPTDHEELVTTVGETHGEQACTSRAHVDRRDVVNAFAVHAPATEHVGRGVRVRHPRHGERCRAVRALLQGRPGGRAAGRRSAGSTRSGTDEQEATLRQRLAGITGFKLLDKPAIPTSRSRSSPSPRRGSRLRRPCGGRWSGSARATV